MIEDVPEGSLESWKPRIDSPGDREDVLRLAFDYRGDVTLTLSDGTILEGFVSNLRSDADPPCVEFFVANDGVNAPPRRIPWDDVNAVGFTGRDMADGRSWEAWVKKWEKEHGTKRF